MGETLDSYESTLTGLERQVIAHYTDAKGMAESENKKYICLPQDISSSLLEILTPLRKNLTRGDESGKLELVSEQHDNLRIRMMYLTDLLERDIPIDYMDRAFSSFRDFEHLKVESSLASQRANTSIGNVQNESQKAGLMRSLFGWVFADSSKTPRAAQQQSRHKVPTSCLRNKANYEQLRDNSNGSVSTKKLVVLRYSMEKDPSKLVKSGQKLNPMPQPPFVVSLLSHFEARDLGDTHFSHDKDWEQLKARTPEELRRKLAQREKKK
jgi:hypothetical protein